MPSLRLDDDWFLKERKKLLVPSRFGRPFSYAARGLVSARLGQHGLDSSTQGALAHLSPRHRTAVKQHMQLYRACLESLGLVPSHEIVNAAVQVEWLWYVTPFKRFYRDHLAHVMKVALIGHELLASPESPLADAGEPLVDRVARGLTDRTFGTPALRMAARRAGVPEADLRDVRFWRAAVLDAVRIAGLLHDMAYPDDMAGKVARAAAPVRPPPLFGPADSETARHAVTAMEGRLCLTPFSRGQLTDTLKPPDRAAAEAAYAISHAPRAAYSVLRMKEESDRVARLSSFDAFVMEWAALGAMMHDLDKLFEVRHDMANPQKEPKIKDHARTLGTWMTADKSANAPFVGPGFRDDPVSYIVALADQLQDFGRMHYAASPSSAERSDAVVRSSYPCRSVDITTQGPPGAFQATLTFDLLGPAPFDASAEDLRKARRYKLDQSNLVFGDAGWLRGKGLFADVTLVTLDTELPRPGGSMVPFGPTAESPSPPAVSAPAKAG